MPIVAWVVSSICSLVASLIAPIRVSPSVVGYVTIRVRKRHSILSVRYVCLFIALRFIVDLIYLAIWSYRWFFARFTQIISKLIMIVRILLVSLFINKLLRRLFRIKGGVMNPWLAVVRIISPQTWSCRLFIWLHPTVIVWVLPRFPWRSLYFARDVFITSLDFVNGLRLAVCHTFRHLYIFNFLFFSLQSLFLLLNLKKKRFLSFFADFF